ncbi:MAG TPA: DUF3662 and FHA domain-containing protein [bacterium]|nr:DUF3662 and FHA domain-containing protein [bacterium]
MSLLLRLERRIEALVEGMFSRWAHDRVHPVEIGRRLFRAMDESAVAGLDGLMVPNVYRVFLHPREFAPYAELAAPLVAELESSLRARAAELGGRFPGTVRVTLDARDEITPGAIYVEARLAPDETADAGASADASGAARPVSDGDTRIYRRRDPAVPALRLRVHAGPSGAAGREFSLDRPVMTVGRRPDQDIVLDDPSVSRAHARIEITADGVSILDLGSTNGTLVNGRPSGSAQAPLRPGDRIQIGTVLLELLSAP